MKRIRNLLVIFAFLSSGISMQAQVVIMPSMFGVQVKPYVPPTVQTQGVTMNDEGDVISTTVNVTAPAGTIITERGVCYWTTPNPVTSNTKVTDGQLTSSYNANLTLNAATTYYIRGYAVSGGQTYYGNEVRAVVYQGKNSLQEFIVPSGVNSATIKILGASGGTGGGAYGGKGAALVGTFNLTPNETIKLVVGQKGQDGDLSQAFRAGGGGGGTFVYRTTGGNPLIIAGGGGGGELSASMGPFNGEDGQAGMSGTKGKPVLNVPVGDGGTNGNGGTGRTAGGGAGWFSAGSCAIYPQLAGKRDPWDEGNYQSTQSFHQYGKGGYGGGGSAQQDSGGGGGGYSGGSACAEVPPNPSNGSGGGGGSINYGTSPGASSGVNTGDGAALITW